MKIARIMTSEGRIAYVTPNEDTWMEATGSLQEGWVSTDQPLEPVRFFPPVEPRVLFAIGLNYRAHAEEMGKPLPEHPVVTMKNPAAAVGHRESIQLPSFLPSDSVDFEVELAVVIGKQCKNLTPDTALDAVAGYTVANDVSARDWQKIYSGGQWCKGKGFDTFCPMGPVLVTADELTDPDGLDLTLTLNGEVMQQSNTGDLIFSVREIVSFLSASTTLLPGTVILTGTPPGVGTARTPPVYLQPGDQLQVEIESIGILENTVEEEPL